MVKRAPYLPPAISRRVALTFLAELGALPLLSACAGDHERPPPPDWVVDEPPSQNAPTPAFADAVDASLDVFLPAERDDSGKVVSPGALEAGAGDLLALDDFARLAAARGLLAPFPEDVLALLDQGSAVFRAALNTELDVLATWQRPLTGFRDLPRWLQEAAIDDGMGDARVRPMLEVARVAAFLAFLGAVRSDVGLVAIGYPPFEDHADGLAVSGYPRTFAGRLVDAETEDLDALAASGELDDYTYNQAPAATGGVDLDDVLDARGDLF